VTRELFDLSGTIAHVVESIRPQALKKGLALKVDIAPGIGAWTSDSRRVEQIILNLLYNAVKFTDRGEVSLKACIEAGRLRLSVADTGIGVKAEDLALMFQPFMQVDAGLTRRHEGTGLGLAICRRLAGLLGGEIHAESEFGKGSVFTLTLPDEGKTHEQS
jgi:signal transduction histidine kinase